MTADNAQPERVFDLPEEVVERIAKVSAKNGTPNKKLSEAVFVDTQTVQFDSTPIAAVTEPEIVQTGAGPMIVRRRKTSTTVYRRDGRPAKAPIAGLQKVLSIRDKNGHQVFFTTPPPGSEAQQKFTKICPYCFKKLRGMTDLERESNSLPIPKDEESQELLQALKDEGLYDDVKIKDDDFVLASHIAKRHYQLAMFRRDPILERFNMGKKS